MLIWVEFGVFGIEKWSRMMVFPWQKHRKNYIFPAWGKRTIVLSISTDRAFSVVLLYVCFWKTHDRAFFSMMSNLIFMLLKCTQGVGLGPQTLKLGW